MIISFRHELYFKRGRGHKFFTSLQYGKKREAKALLKFTLPFGNSYEMHVLLNISIPSFKACEAQFSSVQTASGQYNVSSLFDDYPIIILRFDLIFLNNIFVCFLFLFETPVGF